MGSCRPGRRHGATLHRATFQPLSPSKPAAWPKTLFPGATYRPAIAARVGGDIADSSRALERMGEVHCMNATAGASGTLHFSTDDLPERDRLAMFREVYANSIINFDIEPLADAPFQFSGAFQRLPRLGLASGTCSPMHASRTSRHINSDDLVLYVGLTGSRFCGSAGAKRRSDRARQFSLRARMWERSPLWKPRASSAFVCRSPR